MSIVLVVDDSPLVLNQVRDALQADDLDVLVTENPLEVPRLIHRRAPSLVLVDIHMPTMRGDVVARIVRRAFGDPPALRSAGRGERGGGARVRRRRGGAQERRPGGAAGHGARVARAAHARRGGAQPSGWTDSPFADRKSGLNTFEK